MFEEINLFELRKKAAAVYELLVENYGIPMWSKLPPVEELVNTIISQNTNDKNRDVAFDNLIRRFPTMEEVRDADPNDVIECIRYAGLANQKGPRIQNTLREITEQTGGLDLNFLKNWDPQKASDWLTSFKGVGTKTASIVMLFSLNMPAFPVDTHIHRVTGRIGLRPPKMDADQTHELMEKIFLPEQYGTAHINLILLGRRLCSSRSFDCSKCFLNKICETGSHK